MASFAENKFYKSESFDEINVALRPLTMRDQEALRKWLSDPYVLHLTFVVQGPGCVPSLPFSASASDQYLSVLITDKSRMTYAIEANGVHVGNIGLKEYDREKQTSEFFIEIGESEYRGLGIGKAAMAILMDYAFYTLDLREVRLEVLEFNDVAIHIYQQLGFMRTHRSGWHYDSHGQYWQVWGMNLAKERWEFIRRQLHISDALVVTPLAEI